jgi:outer membrane receptor protein involved in Fe transport
VQFEPRLGWPLLQVGLSFDDFTSELGNQSELNPKFGLIWKLSNWLTIRAAAFRVLKRQIGSDQGLEPTQLAGFNQFFDDSNGTISKGVGLAGDFAIQDGLSAGIQLSRRDLSAPFLLADTVIYQGQREDSVSGYLYWLPSDRISVAFEPSYLDFEHGASFDQMRLTELPLSVRYIAPKGWRFGLTATAVEQDGEFDGPTGVESGSDNFWLLDAIVTYRLPRRTGTISLEGTNLLNEEFQFQEVDVAVLYPRYVPEAQIRLRFSLSF